MAGDGHVKAAAEAPVKPRRLRRIATWGARVAAATLVLLLAVAAGLWAWSGTAASLRWAWDTWAAPRGWQAEGLDGSLRGGLKAKRLAMDIDGLRLEATQADLAWDLLPLLQERRIQLAHARAQDLRIEDHRPATATPSAPPQQLSLPLPVAVDEIALGRLAWQAAGTPAPALETGRIAGRYQFAAGSHRLTLRELALAQGRYRGEATLQAQFPLDLQARLQGEVQAPVPGGTAHLPLALEATASGPLAALDLRAALRTVQAAPPPAPAGKPGGKATAPSTAHATGPEADLSARLTPWQSPWLPQAHAQLRQVDLAALWPRAPRTAISGRIDIAPGTQAKAGAWLLDTDLANARPAPWDQGGLPLERLRAQGRWQDGTALVERFEAALGGGRAEGRGAWLGGGAWRLDATVAGVRPGALHTAAAGAPASGQGHVESRGGGLDFEASLRAGPDAGAATRPATRTNSITSPGTAGPAAPAPAAGTTPTLSLRELSARGRWQDGRLQLPQLLARTADARLQGRLDLHLPTRAGEGQLTLEAPGLQARAEGRLAEASGQGQADLRVTQLAGARAWLASLPWLQLPALPEAQGEGHLALTWRGGWRAPTVQVQGDASLAQEARRLRLQLAGEAHRANGAWLARIDALTATGRDPSLLPKLPGDATLRLQQPATLRRADDGTLELGAGSALLTLPVREGPSQARLAWDASRWGGGELHTSGRFTGLPLAWLALAGGVPPTGDLRLDAQWDAHLARTLRLRASLARASGDLTLLAEDAEGRPVRVAAGVREARLTLESNDDNVALGLRWDSERAGSAEGRLSTRLSPGGPAGWQWAGDAPLQGRLQAQLPRMAVWSVLAPPGWRLRGSLAADLAVAGTRAAPRVSGRVDADGLGLRSVVDGVSLQDGRLRARLEDDLLRIDELTLRGPAPAGGEVRATGEARWRAGDSQGPQLRLQARLAALRASVRPDRELTVSGNVEAMLDPSQTRLGGALRVDRARLLLPDQAEPQLGSDVVVRNLPAGAAPQGAAAKAAATAGNAAGVASRPLKLDATIDLGDDFRVAGRGLSARLRGSVAVAATSLSSVRLTGAVETAEGEVQAYGQRLAIARGLLRFTGPADDPALDVLALRRNLGVDQKVGVQVTGRAQSPRVRLWSEPALSEAETLSWLVLGRASATGGAEAALLEQAAVSLLAQRAGMGGGGLAGRFGLDELGVRRDATQGAALTLGKQLADNFYAVYERSVAGAVGTLRVFYDLTRRLTVRAETGDRTGVDLVYTFSFD